MADYWVVTFEIDRVLEQHEVKAVELGIPRTIVDVNESTSGAGGTSVVSVRQAAPTSMDATNRVGSRLRVILGRNRLNVIDVKVRRASDDEKMESKIDDLVQKFFNG